MLLTSGGFEGYVVLMGEVLAFEGAAVLLYRLKEMRS